MPLPLSQQRRRNPSQSALAQVGLFSAGIIHEIKNSLQGVANALFLLDTDQSLSPSVRENVKVARRELSRVFEVSRQTLALVRPEKPARVCITGILEEVLEAYAAKIAYKQITVQRQYEFQGDIMSNPGALRQVFLNIVLNALESVPCGNGRLSIHVYACCRTKEGKFPGVQIEFLDNGPGIPDEYKSRIFQPFFSTKTGKGSGLGLWVTHRLVIQQNGRLRVLTRNQGVPSGTCVSVFFPLGAQKS